MFPPGIVSTIWPKVSRQLERMGVEYDPWQVAATKLTLALDERGKYASTVGGVTWSIPRQVGKTFTIGTLLVALCILFPGLKVVWTAHHARTATNTFRALQGIVTRKRVRVHLKPDRSSGIRTSNGEQEIRFRNGSVIMFGAREHGFGRGVDEVDVMVFDEAQILADKSLEDMVAATNQARHVHGALIFMLGTPPRPTDNGEAFAGKRRRALRGDTPYPGVYLEFSADRDCALDDRAQWAIANPSFPKRTPLESMLRLREFLPTDDGWRREALGIWDEEGSQLVLPGWPSCLLTDTGMPPVDVIGLGVSANEPTFGSIAAAGVWPDGERVNLAAVDRRPGSTWLVAEAKRIQDERGIPVAIDEKCPDATLLPALVEAGVDVRVMKLADYVETCSDLVNRAREGRLSHQAHDWLDAAVAAAAWRSVGDGRKVFGRAKSAGDIDMLEAAAAAEWAAVAARVEPWEAWT